MKIGDESILFFSRVSLLKSSLESLFFFVGKRSIYTGVRMECEESSFFKTGLARSLTKSRVPAAR